MRRHSFLTIVATIVLLLVSADFAPALEPIPVKSGFSGFIRPGVGYLNYKSNMVASFLGFDLSDKKTDSLTGSPDSESTGIVLVPFTLRYTFASTRTQLLIGTTLRDLVRFDLSQQVGVKQEIGRFGMLQGGLLFSGIPAQVWKDPYVVDQNRKETDRDSNGARLVWDDIWGSNFQLQYTYRKIDINSEESGEFLGLSSDDRDLLDRNGDRHVAEVFYRINFAKKHRIVPQFIYARDDLDGDAMANDAFDFQLTYAYFGDPIVLTVNGVIGTADYDQKNPIYDKTRDDDRWGVQGNLYYRNPWNWSLLGSEPMSFVLGAAYFETDANIDFYDQEAAMVTGGLFFKW
ncbi:hypothetical protein D1AOALGA4SA_5458 [Olavius algarvensis Delta 1 endosymbiont]|nr:hypothetical protein D1AOALGA4SA_5458 [Olavius algarvensis Delta 1 endosymbiont]